MRSAEQDVVLVVEDDPGVATLERRRLERAGYHTIVATTAAEAMAVIDQGQVDLIVLDYRLPDQVNGLDFYGQLQAAGHDQPVIMVTGFSDEATIIRALRCGVRDFVTKSVEYLDYLPEAVERVFKQVRLERKLAESEAQLMHAQRMECVGRLAGGVAHEFNNLLQAIRGYARYAMEGLSSEEQRYQDLEQVVTAADRASVLTRELLTFSRRQTLERVAADPNQIVQCLVKLLRPVIGANIELQVLLGDDVGMIDADAGQFQQVLMNLCLNARDAMPSGGRLSIQTERVTIDTAQAERLTKVHEGDHVVITVADTGCGMTAEIRERIFEPFFTTKEVGKGTGLGLAVAYSIVEQHEGRMECASEPGQGTAFKIYVPLVAIQANGNA